MKFDEKRENLLASSTCTGLFCTFCFSERGGPETKKFSPSPNFFSITALIRQQPM